MIRRVAFVFCVVFILWSLKSSQAGFSLSGRNFITIKEEEAYGTFVVKMAAFPDVSRYEIDDSRGIFSIDTQGNVTVLSRVDRETIGDRCDFTVTAYSNHGETAQQKISCVILDVNDHTPKFTRNVYNISVNEKSSAGTVIFSETAIDKDSEQNGQVTYMIADGNEGGVFGIKDPYKCDLVLVKELDFEAKTTYYLNITAEDRPGLMDWTEVLVNVLDGDDLPPKFTAFSYVASLREDAAIGSKVTQVFAEDQDKMLNAPITYELYKNPGGLFVVDNSSGTIRLNGSLNRENVAEYTLRVLARSIGHIPDHAMVSVEVTDVNDNCPTFGQSSYSAAISEDSKSGSTILQVSAKDLDKGENAIFFYSLGSALGTFAVHPSSGFITLNGSLDREVKDSYTFVVIAEETETAEKHKNNATVIIHVHDSNDITPRFTHEFYRAMVMENLPSESFVFQVSAQDNDLGLNGNITYTIVPDGDGHYLDFNITPENGSITIAQSLDRENISVYYLTVKATDNSLDEQTRSSTCQLKVLLEDANDNSPVFDKEAYNLFISEATTVNTTILVIQATDRDKGVNSDIVYTIEGNAAVHSFFNLDDETGALQVIDELDRETTNKYTFVVKATDGGNKSTVVDVTVTLDDVNDNPPQFSRPLGYQFTLREEVESVFLGNVSATDADIHENAEILYSLLPSASSDSFRVNSTTAELYSVAPLDRESSDHHILTVVAQDKGYPTSRRALVRVRINVTDINDNWPRFSASKYVSRVLENQPIIRILALTASDLDQGINSKLKYSILAGNSENKFRIDPKTGDLFTTMPLDREEESAYNLTVLVSDMNGTKIFGRSLNDSAHVQVLVQDQNDNSPIFVNSSYFVSVRESFPICTLVLQVFATDYDEYENIEFLLPRSDDQERFSIDKRTGKISLQKELDYDPPNDEHSFELLVMALDAKNPRLNSTVNVTIAVTDVNDNTPICSQDGDVFLVPEDIPRGMNITTVQCEDRDSSENGQLSYRMTSENNEAPRMFIFNETTQGLLLMKELDYDEGNRSYSIVLHVSDNGKHQLERNMTIRINVVNVNDNAPTFSQPTYKFAIHEGNYLNSTVPLGQVTASDVDSDEGKSSFGEIRFSIVNSSEVFCIDSKTGILSVNGNLDRENKSSPVLIVKATDSDTISPQSSAATVIVHILDENDNSPSFPQNSYVINVTEDATIAQDVVKVTASDLDEGSNANITYEIFSGNHQDKFKIDSFSGNIFVRSTLDRERQDGYSLVILARDGGTPARVSPIEVNINVLDANDNHPVCLSSTWTSTVLENLPAGQAVAQIAARDADADRNGVVAYNLSIDGFEVDAFTGLIRTTKSFDREINQTYNLTVTVFNVVDHSKRTNCSVIVTILDANDNAPLFNQSVYTINVSEHMSSGRYLLRVTAADSDSGRNSEVEYSLLGGTGHFGINHTTGLISTIASLDRELAAQYILRIVASDRGSPLSRSSSATLLVNVIDVNDNAPIFKQAVYTGTILEGVTEPGLVVQVNATDADAGSNAVVTYSITGSDVDGIFKISRSGVISSTVPLDRENRSIYELNVTATDGGTPAKSSVATVVITVEDINDNRPFITSIPREIRISEETLPGSLVYVARAVDWDLGANGVFKFSGFAVPSGKFAINEKTGEIRTIASLDRELNKRYMFYATAVDMGQPSLNSTVVSFNITLSDSNDNGPQFRPVAVIVQLKESTDVGEIFAGVNATEQDHGANAKFLYKIIAGDPTGHFMIDNQTGIISLRRKLDRETTSDYSLVVSADERENSSRTGIGYVTVHVEDVNDEPPMFKSSGLVQLQVQEDAHIGKWIISITAIDGDSGENAKVVYLLTDGDGRNDFNITTEEINTSGESALYTGSVHTMRQLDREQRQFYNLTVLATDGVHNSTSNILIRVLDVNDNSPKFNSSYNFTADISEDTPGGTSIIQISACDSDDGSNAKITYFLEEQDDAFFIDSVTGTIYVGSGGLDRETRAMYNLTVTAADGGGRMVSRQVYFKILDANDHVPLFNSSLYLVLLAESRDGSKVVILDVNATDDDEGNNGKISYSILRGNENDVFSIDSNTGLITTQKVLDRDTTGQLRDSRGNTFYILTVEASDKGSPQEKSTATVYVTVFDVNDNPPVFERSSYLKETADDLSVGAFILQVKATDEDWGQNSNLTYSISDGDQEGVFEMDRFTGVLSLAKVLKLKASKEYNLTVTAQDAGNPPMSATTTVTVFIFPANKYAPTFPSKKLNLTVKEDVLIGTRIAVVNATRLESHYRMFYTLLSADEETFRVNATNGAIMTTRTLDREERTSYELVVMVSDDGPRPLWDSVAVQIYVSDVNDNPPQFIQSSYEFYVAEDGPQELFVGRVQVVDQDEGTNAVVLFFLQGVESDSFTIENCTGIIHTRKSLDREEKQEYNFTVVGRNTLAVPSLDSERIVKVIVTDINDERPTFSENKYETRVLESAAVGTSVIRVNATDSDKDLNSRSILRILYHQSSANSRHFAIDPESGVITTQGPLDRETNSNYTLRIQAQDLGSSRRLENVVDVLILVDDVNDNLPTFPYEYYRFQPNESLGIGDIVGTVEAIDIDEEDNSNVTYEIIAGNDLGVFRIDEKTGVIHLMRSLDRETISQFSLVVRAHDEQRKTQHQQHRREQRKAEKKIAEDDVTVFIEVQDENDNAPKFLDMMYIGGVYEDAAGGVILTVQATDGDIGDYSVLWYLLVNSSEPGMFILDSITGEISATQNNHRLHTVAKTILIIAVKDNHGNVPYNTAGNNATVYILLFRKRDEIVLQTGLPLEIMQEKLVEFKRSLENLTGFVLFIKNVKSSKSGQGVSSLITLHAVEDKIPAVLTPTKFWSVILNKSDDIALHYSKWNLQLPGYQTFSAHTGRAEFSPVAGAFLFLTAAIGVAGVILIILACHRKRVKKNTYKTASTDSRLNLAVACAVDIPGIEAYLDEEPAISTK